MLKAMMLAVCIVFSGVAVATVNYAENTVGANRAVPNRIVEKAMDVIQATSILKAPYSAFYKISGKAGKDNFDFKRVSAKESFPDDRWAKLARSIANQVRIPAPSTGSRVKPSANAYVAFYTGGIEGLEPKRVLQLETSVEGEPNTLAVLVIDKKTSSGSTRFTVFQPVPEVYFFELAL